MLSDMLKLAIVLSPMAACATYQPQPAPRFIVTATTAAGHAYVAGAGDSCATAWQGAKLPADWLEIICIEEGR